MNPRLLVTAALVPSAALGVALAPMLTGSAPTPVPVETPVAAATPVPAPSGVHVTAVTDREWVYRGDRVARVKVDLWADPAPGRARVPTDLVVVLDRSGSMNGTKILDAKAAAAELASMLGPEDRFGLVSFDDQATVVVDLGQTPRDQWASRIDGIQVGGGTGMVEGLQAGLAQVHPTPGRARRVVLISDGQPNTAEGLDDQVHAAARAEVPVTTIGIGADYDESLMQHLADEGAGNFYWVTRGPELGQVLASELSTARDTVASGLALSVTGGAWMIEAAGVEATEGRVPLGTLYAGQRRSLWLTVLVPTSAADGRFDLGQLNATWRSADEVPASLVVDLPEVNVASDPRLAYRNLDDRWAESVVVDEYNELRTRVSGAVRSGDQGAALAAIEGYQRRNELVNGFAANPRVSDNLRELEQLKADVNDNFTGEQQAQKQNLWAKGTRADAYSKRRGIENP